MYLQNKITKTLANINRPYTIYYNEGKISNVNIDDGDIKIKASSNGYCIDIKGAQVILNDLKSIETIIKKMSTSNKSDINTNLKVADSLVDIFSENETTFAVKYFKGKIVSIIIDNPKLLITKTSAGYLLKFNSEAIAVSGFSNLKNLLLKMNIIKETKRSKKEMYDLGFEQLKLEI